MSIKILHTSDWHLGKKLFRKDRFDEHQQFLDWLLQIIKEHQIDALFIAGDIFDSPTPPNSALKQYYDFLANLSEINVSSFIISGNHDSAGLLQATNSILKDKQIYICSKLEQDFNKHCFKVWNKSKTHFINLKTLPYFRNYELLEWAKEDFNISEFDSEKRVKAFSNTLKKFLDFWPLDHNKEVPNILMAHHLFGNFLEAGSEQSLSLSGLDSIPIELVKNYDYIALGHIHKKQYISHSPVCLYTGSPLPMRFSESNDKKISVISFDEKILKHELVTIPVFLPLIQIKCHYSNLDNKIKELLKDVSNKTYLEVILELDEPLSGITDHLRETLNQTPIELLSFIPIYTNIETEDISSSELHSYGMEELFEKYYEKRFPQSTLSNELKSDFLNLLDRVQNENTSN